MSRNPGAQESVEAASVACEPGAMTKAELQRHIADVKELFAQVLELRPLADGWELRVPDAPDMLSRLSNFVALDRLCCPHLRHAIVVEARRGPIWVQLSGPEGTKDALAAEMAGVLPESVAAAAGLAGSEFPSWLETLDRLTQRELGESLPQLHGQLQMSNIRPFDAFRAGATAVEFFEQHVRQLRPVVRA